MLCGLGSLGGDDVEAVERQELLERPADAEVVFDDENQWARHFVFAVLVRELCPDFFAGSLMVPCTDERAGRSSLHVVASALLEADARQDSCSMIRKNPGDVERPGGKP